MSAAMKTGQASVSRGRYRKTQALADVILDIVNVTFADLSLSTRQVYYQCVSRGAIKNEPAAYDRVQRLVVELRREGAIGYSRIVDRTRAMHKRAGWDGPIAIMNAVGKQYRRDLWASQDVVVMVACEKQALEGIFQEEVDRFGACLSVTHGYGSESFLYEWSQEIISLGNEGKTVRVAYFGDHDPTGLDIERHALETLERHLDREGVSLDGWRRHGLLESDFDDFDLVKLPVKKTDTRAKAYLEKYGNRAAELDALPPDVLRLRIQEAIVSDIDLTAWHRLEAVEKVERESIAAIVKNWDTALSAAQAGAR